MCFGTRGCITSGGAGEPFSPGRAPQPPLSNIYTGRGGLGGWLGLGWVGASKSQNPQPLINEACLEQNKHVITPVRRRSVCMCMPIHSCIAMA